MPGDFWDTSGLAKLYVPERGSRWASDRVGEVLAVSELSLVEIASVLQRRFVEHQFTALERDEHYARFLADAQAFQFIAVRDRLLARSAELLVTGVFTSRLRSLDAIQLASVLEWFEVARRLNIESGAFIVADRPLREAAVALGLPVENPEDYE